MPRTKTSPVDCEKAIRLYQSGLNLREVGAAVNRSHEWVRKVVASAGKPVRSRGREFLDRPDCAQCKKPCPKLGAQFCSRDCLNKSRRKLALAKLESAIRVLNNGGSYAAAAEKSGFKSAWHLWGRMHHFGLTEGRKSPSADK